MRVASVYEDLDDVKIKIEGLKHLVREFALRTDDIDKRMEDLLDQIWESKENKKKSLSFDEEHEQNQITIHGI